MAVKNFQLDRKSSNEEKTHLQQDEHEAEEILSLCDLVIHSSDLSAPDSFSQENGQSSSSDNSDDGHNSGNGDDFKFFNEEFTATTLANAEMNYFIFCGKIIPCKEDSQERCNFEGSPRLQRKTENDSTFPCTLNNKKPHSAGKASLMRSNTKPKSRWPLSLFGMPKSPAEMELGDIRSRQSRKATATKMFPMVERGEAVKSKDGRWGRMLRLFGLGYKSKHANDVVKDSFVSV